MKINWGNVLLVIAVTGLWVIIANGLGIETWMVYVGSALLGFITAQPFPIIKRRWR